MKLKKQATDLLNTARAIAPIVINAVKSGQLFNPRCELTEPNPDILCEYDVEIPMSERFCVTANVYRSKRAAERGESVPVEIALYPSSTFFEVGEEGATDCESTRNYSLYSLF